MWVDLREVEAARNAWGRIGELFVEKALITRPELEEALAVQAAGGQSLGEVLVSQGLVSSREMAEVLVEQLGRRVAKEDGYGAALWAEIRRRASRREQPPATTADSADELNQRISQLMQHLTDTQLALDQERAACESARAEAAELATIVDRLQAERDERSRAEAKRRRTIKRTLFGAALHLAQE
ncbi:MAG TPA: hypothetical protein VHS03_07860 [Gaiellaceae bacterium]|jgi:hypothetical protein|nr:hypothetical protein [Gaiellaceae bacterium]